MVTLMVVLGSGGHTAEMLKLLSVISLTSEHKIHFIAAKTDTHSHEKALKWLSSKKIQAEFHFITRAREVGQHWCSSILTSAMSLISSIHLMRICPDILLANGPGTCVPIIMHAFISKCFMSNRIIYVESFARVKTLSLTGKIVYPFVDRFIVQWPDLVGGKTEYIGKLY
jgi:beta-1,4-N-acetylglucosaminyltransferase